MKRDLVTSSNIAEVGYDPNNRIIEVQFNTGAIYQYFDVPQQVYDELMGASSKGGYVNSNIKGKYRYARV